MLLLWLLTCLVCDGSGGVLIRNDTSNIAIVITGGPSNNQTSLQSAAAALLPDKRMPLHFICKK